jgi:hypothetical protein
MLLGLMCNYLLLVWGVEDVKWTQWAIYIL